MEKKWTECLNQNHVWFLMITRLLSPSPAIRQSCQKIFRVHSLGSLGSYSFLVLIRRAVWDKRRLLQGDHGHHERGLTKMVVLTLSRTSDSFCWKNPEKYPLPQFSLVFDSTRHSMINNRKLSCFTQVSQFTSNSRIFQRENCEFFYSIVLAWNSRKPQWLNPRQIPAFLFQQNNSILHYFASFSAKK